MGDRAAMQVSIIIPAYNAEATLGECLAACVAQTHPHTNVIVVDDGSIDTTPDIAKSYPVECICQENAGPAAARNRGAHAATGDIIVFTDSDCIAEPDWIEKLLTGFTADDVVAVGGSYGIANEASLLARMIHEEIRIRHAQFQDEVDYLGSFNVAYRRDAFDAVGGFDETFRMASGEDNDLAYRLHDNGGHLRFVPDAIVAHYHPAHLWPYLRTQFYHGFWRMKLYAKHPGRSGGDQYASRGEFAGPPLSLLILALVAISAVVALVLSAPVFLIVLFLVAAVTYSITKQSLVRQIADRLGVMRSVPFEGMLFLRDVARGLGLIKGVWTFMILRRETA
jgi:GT2 family glycosyltransferase